jgi:chemotaxis protein methyltransferase CheR
MSELIHHITRQALEVHGVDISVYDSEYILKMTSRRVAMTADGDTAAYRRRLDTSPSELTDFILGLNNTYTDFFRDVLTFAFLEQIVLPGLVERACNSEHGSIRIWSAGCSSGQEAWSVAMLLDEIIAARGNCCSYRIFATDISYQTLKAGRRGKYERNAIRTLRLRHLDNCCMDNGNGYEIIPRLRHCVEFSEYDLLDPDSLCPPPCIYGDLDLVLCCNVILYYRDDIRRLILEKIHRSLADNGVFVAGESEREIVTRTKLFRALAPYASVFTVSDQPRTSDT